MAATWVTADPHFGHAGVCRFTRADGTKLRPWDNPDEMDEALVKNWNDVVGEQDRVYLLGDVVMNRRCLPTLGRLKGRKVLVKGNHDIFRLQDYAPYFDDISAYVIKQNKDHKYVIFSHIPVHPAQLIRFGMNVHGHLHSNVVMDGDKPDLRYRCVSVEHTNFTPITFEEATK